jgi:hypothetical protein
MMLGFQFLQGVGSGEASLEAEEVLAFGLVAMKPKLHAFE